MKEKIIEGAEKLFFQYGVRSVSMDDVSRELSMSKKTLYQYFTNKDELVTEVALFSIEKEKNQFDGLNEEAENAINELFLISACIKETVKNMNPSLIYDLRKYHPNGWEVFQNFKYEFIKGTVNENLKRGKAEGFYRKEIHCDVISTLRVETIQMVFDGAFANIQDITFTDIQLQVFDHFVHGLLTEKGLKQYQLYQKREEVKQ
ncbi:MAG: TetR/AcrR family transcriptional regulator [Cyclobacteriaceae bacterium]